MRGWNERPARILWGVWHRRTAAAEAPNPAYSRIVGGPRYRLTKALTLERLKGLAWEP